MPISVLMFALQRAKLHLSPAWRDNNRKLGLTKSEREEGCKVAESSPFQFNYFLVFLLLAWHSSSGLLPEYCGKKPPEQLRGMRGNAFNRTIATLLWVHREL